tara:strand:- start:346 stop:975 length:630 start_codon:yes stop_codon:yes gene_type:complete
MTNWEKDRKHLEAIGVGTFDDFPPRLYKWLNDNISDKIEANDFLAGHLKNEYYYEKPPKEIFNYIVNKSMAHPKLRFYSESISVLTKNAPFVLNKLWVNLQKKYEFNPLHDHSGIFSFIIPLKIPYKLEDENKALRHNKNRNSFTSRLCFVTINNVGKIIDTPVNMDESYVGKCMIFPAVVKHLVYPFFTSDDYRITVSGNIALNTGTK